MKVYWWKYAMKLYIKWGGFILISKLYSFLVNIRWNCPLSLNVTYQNGLNVHHSHHLPHLADVLVDDRLPGHERAPQAAWWCTAPPVGAGGPLGFHLQPHVCHGQLLQAAGRRLLAGAPACTCEEECASPRMVRDHDPNSHFIAQFNF